MKAPIKLPGFRQSEGDPIKRRPPQMLELHGNPTMVLHCQGVASGILADRQEAGHRYEGQIMLTCYTAGEIGLMYLMDIAQARQTAAGLNRICDIQEANAKTAAAEALQKAATK